MEIISTFSLLEKVPHIMEKFSIINKINLKLTRRKVKQGDAQAQFDLGLIYSRGEYIKKDECEAVYWFRKAAEQKHVEAQFYLGARYCEGEGVVQNRREAVSWFLLAAEHEHAGAQTYLGGIYYEGEGIDKDEIKAECWWRKAAEQGDAISQFNMAVMYVNRKGGVHDDKREAYIWLLISKANGYKAAVEYLKENSWKKLLKIEEIESVEQEATKRYEEIEERKKTKW